MTPRERFIAALERRPLTGRVPHFELVFFLTMEAFGKVHPSYRNYGQWLQMEERERELHRRDCAQLYVDTAERFEHSAIFLHPNPGDLAETCRLIEHVRALSGDRFFLMLHGDATLSVPDGRHMEAFNYRLVDAPDQDHAEATRAVDNAIRQAKHLAAHGKLDGFALCADYCFNSGPFFSPALLSELITPYLARLTNAYRDLGFYVIKHTDGNILPILDQLIQTNPHALHSLDPQAVWTSLRSNTASATGSPSAATSTVTSSIPARMKK